MAAAKKPKAVSSQSKGKIKRDSSASFGSAQDKPVGMKTGAAGITAGERMAKEVAGIGC